MIKPIQIAVILTTLLTTIASYNENAGVPKTRLNTDVSRKKNDIRSKLLIKLIDTNKKQHAVSITKEREKETLSFNKCQQTNKSYSEDFAPNLFNIDSLNSIYSSFTNNRLNEENITAGDVEESGINLYSILSSQCGGTKVCRVRSNLQTNSTITVGFLTAYGLSHTIFGAMPLAVAAVNRDPTLLPGIQLRFVSADIGRPRPGLNMDKDSYTLRVMTQMRDLGVVAFFGLDGACSTEAKLAAAWNLPLLSHSCVDAQASVPGLGLGATFARTLPPAYKISKSVIALLKTFKWTKFAIITGEAPTAAAEQTKAIKELALANGMTVTMEQNFLEYLPKSKSKNVMDGIVENTYKNTRIYIFLGENIALVDFVMALKRRGLLENGEYAVVVVDDEIYDPQDAKIINADHLYYENVSDVDVALRNVLKLTPSFPTNPHYKTISNMIRALSAAPPFCVPNYHKIFEQVSVPIKAAHLYDAVTLWARAATAAKKTGLPLTDGVTLMKLLRATTYRSVQGFDVFMDEGGDAEGNYTVIGLVPDQSAQGWSAQPVASFAYTNTSSLLPELVGGDRISWIGGFPPIAEPSCGFDGAKCTIIQDPGLLGTIAAIAAALLAATLLAKHYRYEQKLASVLWKIDAKELTFIHPYNDYKKIVDINESDARKSHTPIAMCRGNIVAYKRLRKKNIDITRAVKKELKQMRELRHENLNTFVGVCIDNGSACILSTYCSRGSLSQILSNEDINLDDMFIASLVADLLRGLIYLHDSSLQSHGNLTSNNCLVDSKWVLQIADYGLHTLKQGSIYPCDAIQEERRLLWRAPELLRDVTASPRGSQKGDVYSFAIVLYEILGRNGPWGDIDISNAEIIGRVRQPIGGVIFRPSVSGLNVSPSVIKVMRDCWHEKSDRRPDIRLVRIRLKELHAGMKTNIFDNMLAMMEKYASNLEDIVDSRTEQLLAEKKRTDDLLHRMLPRSVSEALKRGDRVKAESFDCVTIYFSDIVEFTKLAATYTPMEVVGILNNLYTCLDDIISYYNVYKVETIGDGYMVVGGAPERCAEHASEIAKMALRVLSAVPKINFRYIGDNKLRIRVGIHSGQCAAGVVGTSMPRYCLFGDTVNTAARMESSSEPQKIQVSNDTYQLLCRKGFVFEERGIVDVKGKGDMKTWWLIGESETKENEIIFQTKPNVLENSVYTTSMVDLKLKERESTWAACKCILPQRENQSEPAVSFCE